MCKFADTIAGFTENVTPGIFADLATEKLDVMRQTPTIGNGGGQVNSAPVAVNSAPIPCTISVSQKSEKDEKSGQIISITSYRIQFPMTVETKSSDRLKILGKSGNPERVFKIIGLSVIDNLYKAKCELEGK